MAKVTWRKLKSGDVFSLPVGNKIALGQIVEPGEEFLMCVFHQLFEEVNITPSDVALLDVSLVGLCMDEGFYVGRWKIMGNCAIHQHIPRPRYVINTKEGMVLKDYSGTYIRQADKKDIEFYGYKTNYSAGAFEKAMRGIHGLEDVSDDHEIRCLSYESNLARST